MAWTKGAAQAGRNIRSVWTIATRPYPGAHFAVFPPELPERFIKAGCPEGAATRSTGGATTASRAGRRQRRVRWHSVCRRVYQHGYYRGINARSLELLTETQLRQLLADSERWPA